MTNIFSDSYNTMNLRSSDVPQLHNASYSSFGTNASFVTSPRILLAFSSFDVSKAANLRLKASICSVSATGVAWYIEGWCDTLLYSAEVSYIALGSSSSGCLVVSITLVGWLDSLTKKQQSLEHISESEEQDMT